MFDLPAVQISTKDRVSVGHGVGEVVATAGLVLLIFALARTGRAALSAAAVGAYIGAAYWFTSSTSFANPAVTIGRMFSDTFAGIAPGSAPLFVGRPAGRRRGRAAAWCCCCIPTPPTLPTGSSSRTNPVHRTEGELSMSKPSVLFVCVHNAGRSQMAAAFLTHLSQRRGGGPLGRIRTGRSGEPGRRRRRWPRSASTSPPNSRRSSPTPRSASPTW